MTCRETADLMFGNTGRGGADTWTLAEQAAFASHIRNCESCGAWVLAVHQRHAREVPQQRQADARRRARAVLVHLLASDDPEARIK